MRPFEYTDSYLEAKYEEYLERLEWESLTDEERQQILDEQTDIDMANNDDCWNVY